MKPFRGKGLSTVDSWPKAIGGLLQRQASHELQRKTTEPFDLVFSAGNSTFTQVVNTWYYRTGSTFARDYGAESPKEDWSTAWEAALSEDPADRVGIASKVSEVNRLFDLL